jgi:hypothetical protein
MTIRVLPTAAATLLAVTALAACSKSATTASAPTATVTVTTTVTAPAAAPASPVAVASSAPASSAPASLSTTPDPCSLLSQSEASTLADTKLNPAVEAGGDVKTLCQYAGPTTGPTAQVQVIVGDGAKKELDIDRTELSHKFITVPGIGDEADEEDDAIFIHKGDTWVMIGLVRLNDPATNVQRVQDAAKIVASRMP